MFTLMTMVLSQIAVPCDNPRIRKDFRQIDQEGKWNRVANAFAQMKSDGKLIEYTNKHFNESYHTHYTMEFLTWHRKMIWEMEDELRAIGGDDLTLPYIDWAQDGDLHDGKIDRAVIFTPYFYGSTPTDKCASGRIYNSWNVPDSYGLGKCLTRTTDQHYLVDGWAATDILMLSTNFSDFLLSVENGIHDHVHERIGGAMPTMYSPIDPTFYGHHGFIDMLFVNFQHIQNSWTTFPIPSIANKSFKIFNENRTHNDVYQMKNMCVQYERYKPNNNKLKKRKDSQSYQNVTKLEYAKYNKQLASHYDKIKEYVKDNKKEEGLKAIAAFYGDTGFIAINDPPDPDMIHHMGMDPKLAAEITNRSNSARLELAKFGNFTVQGKAVPDTGNRARNIASSGCAVFFGLFVMLVMLVGTSI